MENNQTPERSITAGIEPKAASLPAATPRLDPREQAEVSENAVFPEGSSELNALMELIQEAVQNASAPTDIVQTELIAQLDPIIGPDGEELDFENLEAAAAGGGQGGGGDGSGFVRLLRIAEGVTPLEYNYAFDRQDVIEGLPLSAQAAEVLNENDPIEELPGDDEEPPELPPTDPKEPEEEDNPIDPEVPDEPEEEDPPTDPETPVDPEDPVDPEVPDEDEPEDEPEDPPEDEPEVDDPEEEQPDPEEDPDPEDEPEDEPDTPDEEDPEEDDDEPEDEDPELEDPEDPVDPEDEEPPVDPEEPDNGGSKGNNGWGNGDQDAPGNSLDNNNAENSDAENPLEKEKGNGGNTNGGGNPGNSSGDPVDDSAGKGNPGNDKEVGNSPWDGETGASSQPGNGKHQDGVDRELEQPGGKEKGQILNPADLLDDSVDPSGFNGTNYSDLNLLFDMETRGKGKPDFE